ncbi:MAG: invasion associated locus B family protein [Beijerinckiaceae bacterium]|nr:invasion associated locus B family protein [Beijerinckiaceae bacterium]
MICMSRRAFRGIAGAFIATCAALAPAQAQTPDRSSDVYQDWLLNCSTQRASAPEADKAKEAAARPVCEIVQTFRNRNNNQVIALIAIGRVDPKAERKIVVQAPVGVWLPDGVTISADKASVTGRFLRCTPEACIAEADAKKEIMDALRSGAATAIEFSDASRTKARLTISPRGFADALAALEKRN